MKHFFAASLALIAVSLAALSTPSHAVVQSASLYSQAYSSVNLTTSAYVTAFSSLTKSIKGMYAQNTGANAVYVAVGASGSESKQMLLPPQTAGTVPAYFPLVVSQGQRISVTASTGTISSGNLWMSVLYN